MSAFQATLLAWGEATRRDLPWRRTRDPWAVLVSEVMLAQTQANRVVPKWRAFMARWPDPPACAAAPVGAVIEAWSGLGYNRRAVFLHRAAGIITGRHGGSVPSGLAALSSLPGVGAYTSRAVLAFAFGRPVGVVDTNAARVLARAVAGRTLARSEAQALADSLVPTDSGWAWNQAMIDLGATVCTARRPRCGSCPLRAAAGRPGLCAWTEGGGPDPAVGSAGTSRPQSMFAGSDRQGRGRLLARLTADAASGPPGDAPSGRPADAASGLCPDDLAAAAGWPGQRVRAMAAVQSLIDDGLAAWAPDGTLGLPAGSGIGHTDAWR